jgi:hypothetical protein
MFFVPAGQFTAEPELLDDKIVVRTMVGPVVEYVPTPTSHSMPSVTA